MQFMRLILAPLSTIIAIPLTFLPSLGAEDAGKLAQQGLKALQAKNYKEADKLLSRAATLNSRDPGYQYYSSLAAYQAGNAQGGKAALSRLFLSQTEHSPYCNPARELHKRYVGGSMNNHAYYVMKNGMLTSWSRKQMPLKVYISNGLALPEAYRGKTLNVQQLSELQEWLKKPGAINTLQLCPGYQSQFATQAKSGISEWSWAVQERIVTYQFVNDPRGANVMIFWAPRFPSSSQAGQTLYLVSSGESRPVIMELRTDFSPYSTAVASQSIRNAAAHEFGHALGIQNHSPFGGDLMYNWQFWSEKSTYRISENDKETLRALYSVTPHQNF